MPCLGSVQQKMGCVFQREVKEEPSSKREGQPFQVVATKNVNPVALESHIDDALATEKLDGTCCYVAEHEGRPHLWARLDRKRIVLGRKRRNEYKESHGGCGAGFTWNLEEDFKTVPNTWIPARGDGEHHNGHPLPDKREHILGWVLVERDDKLYPWHSSVVNYDAGAAIVLRPGSENEEELLEIAMVPLADLLGQTLELIGAKINGNPYKVGFHLLVAHGTVRVRNPPPLDFQQLHSWFKDSPEGRVEGIVWHCHDGTMFKVHRQHMRLGWPGGRSTYLGSRPVVINVDGEQIPQRGSSEDRMDMLTAFSRLNGQHFSRLPDIHI